MAARRSLILSVALGLGLLCAALGAWQTWPAGATHPANLTAVQAEPAAAEPVFWPENVKAEDGAWTGRLVRVDEHLALLTVRGNPKERGTAHGTLLREEVRRLVKSVNQYLTPSNDERGRNQFAACVDGARAMKRFLDDGVWDELEACAAAAEVDADHLLLAQLFGDVNRAKGFSTLCSSFAAFGPATKDGKPLVGRNFDYGGHGLEGTVPLILQEIPTGEGAGRPFVTIGYAGILNGWTAVNDRGLYASNNTLFGGTDSLEGISTCFLLRKIVERAETVEDGVALVEKGPRACTTGMLVAGRNKAGAWDARFVEYDAKKLEVVKPVNGVVLATNSRQLLATSSPGSANPGCSRYQTLKKYLGDRRGALSFDDPKQNPPAERGVYMTINLHCALLDLEGGRFRLAVSPGGGSPAAEHPFRTFRIEKEKVVLVPAEPARAP